jgi:hypothetical protein
MLLCKSLATPSGKIACVRLSTSLYLCLKANKVYVVTFVESIGIVDKKAVCHQNDYFFAHLLNKQLVLLHDTIPILYIVC